MREKGRGRERIGKRDTEERDKTHKKVRKEKKGREKGIEVGEREKLKMSVLTLFACNIE